VKRKYSLKVWLEEDEDGVQVLVELGQLGSLEEGSEVGLLEDAAGLGPGALWHEQRTSIAQASMIPLRVLAI
jgi:hypothetical protein